MPLYRKELYVFEGDRPVEAVIRSYTEADFPGLIRIQQESFLPVPIRALVERGAAAESHQLIPQGALCVEIAGEPAASVTGLIVNYDPSHGDHTWEDITNSGYIRNHDPNGNTLYIVDIGVRPFYRKLGLGKWLMQSMYEVVVQLGLKRLLGGGRLPGYHRYASEMPPEAYVGAVLEGKLKDPVMTFLLRCGRTPLRLVPNYLEDEESLNYAMLMEWKNPFLAEK